MSTGTQLTMFASNDGFADAAADYAKDLLRGELLKCTDGHWLVGKEGEKLAFGIRMVAVGTAAAWVKWAGGKPAEYRVRRPGEELPDRDELGDLDKSDWEAGPDDMPRDPWQNTRFLWLTDPETAALYTYSTSSWSGRSAVIGLGDQITRMRTARPGAAPIVEFHSGPLQTKFGKKMKPILKVVGWVGGADNGAVELPKLPTPKAVNDMHDDSVPF